MCVGGLSSKCFLSSFNYRVNYKRACRDVLAFSLTQWFLASPPPVFFAWSERSEQTAAVGESSLGTYQMTLEAPGVPRPTCTRFSGDRSSISEEAWEDMKQNKCSARDR